jgi:hypothetical protein
LRNWFFIGLVVIIISTIIGWITGFVEILVFLNLIVGIISLVIAFYIQIGLSWFYRFNEFRNNHDHADYNGRHNLKYKFIAFGIPNVVVGEIVNRVFDIWT